MKTKHALTFRKALCLLTAGILLSGCAMNSASSEPPKDSPAQHSGENFGQNPHHAEHDAVIPRRGAVKRENKQTVSNESDAMQVLEAQLPDMGLKGKAEDNFRVEMTDTNSVGKTYVMQQQYQGIDVYGATVLVPTDADSGNEYLIDGSVNGIAGDVVADLTEKQAQHMLTECSELGQTDFNVLSHGLVMYPDHAGDYRLCYSFGVTTVQEDGSRKEQNVFLDADSGELVGCDDTSVFSETIRHTSDSFFVYI